MLKQVNIPPQPKKTTDNPGTSRFTNSPSDYIVVNDPSLVESKIEHSCVILFDWDTFISEIISSKKDSFLRNAFKKGAQAVLKELTKNSLGNQGNVSLEYGLNKYINKSLTEFRVNLTSVLGGNSCNFSLENFDDKWIIKTKGPFYGQSVIQEGIRFTIDARGRFDSKNFYRIFTGTVSDISEIHNPTERSLQITAEDPSRFLSKTRYNVRPSLAEPADLVASRQKPTIWASNIQGINGGVIVKHLLDPEYHSDKIELAFPYLWEPENDESTSSIDSSGKKVKLGIGLPVNNEGVLNDKYRRNWHLIRSENNIKTYRFDKSAKSKALIWGHTGVIYTQLFGSLNLFFSEFKTRQDIITDMANITYFTAYVDAAGHFHYHPPRFEWEAYLDLKNGIKESDKFESEVNNKMPLVHSLFDDEIISQSYSQSEKEIVTVCKGIAEGGFGIWQQLRNKTAPNYMKATIVWEDGINRFGFREAVRSTSAVKDEFMINIFTAAFLLRRNQERFSMTATVPMRPELQVDRPIYDYTKDKVYYIRNVNHSYTAGGDRSGGTYTTSIICNAGRRKDEKIASNVFAISDNKALTSFYEFINNYSPYYNLKDMKMVVKDKPNLGKKDETSAASKKDNSKREQTQ